MKLTIIPADGIVSIDGEALFMGMEMGGIPAGVHAIQWDDDQGEIEFTVDANGVKPENQKISAIAAYQDIIDAWALKHEAALAPAMPETPEQLVLRVTIAIQTRLDNFARTKNYDGILSATTYATSTVPKFNAEGQYAVNARDATWAKAYELLAAYENAGALPDVEEVLAQLPALAWPD